MKITITNKIRVRDPGVLKDIIMAELRMENPKYESAVSNGRSTFKIPPTIFNFSILPDDSLNLPRGYLRRLQQLLKEFDIKDCIIEDDRFMGPFNFDIDSSNIKLRDYQMKAITNLISNGTEGLLVAPAGSGKTVMGVSLIPMLGQQMLWLTHTKPLMNQVVERVQSFLPCLNKEDIGVIGSGKWDVGKIFTVAMVQTLVRNPIETYKLKNQFGTVVLDECLVEGSLITMLDGTSKPIENIKDNDITTFGRVSNKFYRYTDNLIELRTSGGVIKGTTTHMLPCIPRVNLSRNKHENKYMPFEEKDVVFDKLANIHKGDFLLIPEQVCHTEKYKFGVKQARLLSLILCDGHLEKHKYCVQIGIVKDKEWFLKEMIEDTSFIENVEIKTSGCKRGDLIIRCYNEEIIKYVDKYVKAGKKSNNVEIPPELFNASLEEIKNFIQVAFDTEGSVTDQITLTMSSHKFVLGLHELLKKFGIIGKIIPIKRHNYLRIALSGHDAFLFCKKIGFSIERKQKSLSKLMYATSKFRKLVTFRGVQYRCIPVIAKSTIVSPKTKVYDFTTEQHLFLANGVLSSNCHHLPATTFTQVVGSLNPYYLYGLTATHLRRDGMHKLMFQTIGDILYTVPLSDVKKGGNIVVPQINCRHINCVSIRATDFGNIVTELAENDIRNNLIVKDILNEATQNNICVVITERRNHADILFDKISKQWPKTGIATGSYSNKDNKNTLELLRDAKISILVTTSALLGEGFDHAPINRGFICLPFRNMVKTEQVIGRIQRSSAGKSDAIIYDYIDNHSLLQHQFKNSGSYGCRHNIYTKLGCRIRVV